MVSKHGRLNIGRQCALLGLSPSTYYYTPRPENTWRQELKRKILDEYADHPMYGSPRMTEALRRKGEDIGRGLIASLMREMGLRSVLPRPRLSLPARGAQRFPYLLTGIDIVSPNQVWATDITYLFVAGHFVYLVAVIDWHTRKVLAWRISNTLTEDFCLAALDEAVALYGRPEIFNSDQGSQFTGEAFTGRLLALGIRISQDGKGRCIDNIRVERFWWSVKYECTRLHCFATVDQLRKAVSAYISFYNTERPHQALSYATPDERYTSQQIDRKAC